MTRLGRGFPRHTFAPRTKRLVPTTLFGQSTLASTTAITTAGVRKTFSNSVTALTDAQVTAGVRKTFSSSVTALTDGITTTGSRKVFGQSTVSLTDTITTIPALLFAKTAVLDNFNRADGTIGTTNWTASIAPVGDVMPLIVGNKATANTDSMSAWWKNQSFAAKQEVYATIAAWPGTTGINTYLYARLASPGTSNYTGYRLTISGRGASIDSIVLLRRDIGSGTVLLDAVAPSDFQVGDVVGMQLDGNTITIIRVRAGSMVILGKVVDPAPLIQSGYLGFWPMTNTAIDDFGGGTLGLITGVSSVTLTDNITTTGKRTTFGQSTLAVTANITTGGQIRAVLSTLLLYDDASGYSAGATITDHTMWVSGTFPLDGHNDVSQISDKWWTDSGFAVEDSGWIYSRKPTDWGDKYFFRLATQLVTFRDFAVHWSYKSAAYGADGYVVEGSDATEVWLRKTTQYNTYIIQIDHQDGRVYCKRKVPYDNTSGPLATGIANKGIYYVIPTNSNTQPYASSNYSLYTGAGYTTPPGDLAHDSSTAYQFKSQIETVGPNVRIRLWRLISGAWLLIGDWTDDGRIGIYDIGGPVETQGDHVDASYYTGISGYGVYWNTNPITVAGGSGFRADNIKVWFDNVRVADLISGNVRWGGSSTLAVTATSTTAGVVTSPSAGTDTGTGVLKFTPSAVEIREQVDAATDTFKFTPSGADTVTPTVVELGTYRGAANTTTGAVTIPAGGVAVGHTVILAVCAAGDRTFTVSDGRGNVYATDVRLPNAFTLTVALISARITTALLAGDTITITLSTAGNFAFGAYDVATLLSPAFDKSASAIGTGVTADSGATATTSQADELLFAVHGWNATGGTYAVMDSTWARPPTDPLLTTVTTIRLMGVEFKNVSATGAYNATGTYSGASTQWAAAIGTYKFGTGVAAADTGTGILLLSVSAADISDRVDSTTGVLAFSPSSSEVYTPGTFIYTDAATGAITFTPSAAETRERVDSATVPLALSPSPVELFAGVDAATGTFALTPSGTETLERTGTDAATGVVSLVPLSSEVLAATDSATGTLAFAPNGTDAGQRVDIGTTPIAFTAAGTDVLAATESGTGQLALTASGVETTSAAGTDSGIEVFKFTPSGTETLQTTDAATASVVFLPSASTEARISTDANTGALTFSVSAAEVVVLVDAATVPLLFTLSGAIAFAAVDTAVTPLKFLPGASEGRESADAGTSALTLSPDAIDVYVRVDAATALLHLTPEAQEAGFIFFDAATVYLHLTGHAILFDLSGTMRRVYGARMSHRLWGSGLNRPIGSRLSRVYSGGLHD